MMHYKPLQNKTVNVTLRQAGFITKHAYFVPILQYLGTDNHVSNVPPCSSSAVDCSLPD